MIYAALWRALPGPVPVKILLCLVLALAAVAFCVVWLFRRIAPLMPCKANPVSPSGAAAHPAYAGVRS